MISHQPPLTPPSPSPPPIPFDEIIHIPSTPSPPPKAMYHGQSLPNSQTKTPKGQIRPAPTFPLTPPSSNDRDRRSSDGNDVVDVDDDDEIAFYGIEEGQRLFAEEYGRTIPQVVFPVDRPATPDYQALYEDLVHRLRPQSLAPVQNQGTERLKLEQLRRSSNSMEPPLFLPNDEDGEFAFRSGRQSEISKISGGGGIYNSDEIIQKTTESNEKLEKGLDVCCRILNSVADPYCRTRTWT